MPGLIATDSIYDPTGCETIRQQRVVGMMVMEPCRLSPVCLFIALQRAPSTNDCTAYQVSLMPRGRENVKGCSVR